LLILDLQLTVPDHLQQLVLPRTMLLLHSVDTRFVGEFLLLVLLLPERETPPHPVHPLLQPSLPLQQVLHDHRVHIAMLRPQALFQLPHLLPPLLPLRRPLPLEAGLLDPGDLPAEDHFLDIALKF
jgi:hypothetical protein